MSDSTGYPIITGKVLEIPLEAQGWNPLKRK